VVDDGEIGSPPTLSAHDKDDTVERCSEVNRPVALLKLGLRRLCAYLPPLPYISSGTGNDRRFLALPVAGLYAVCGRPVTNTLHFSSFTPCMPDKHK
jgi:hypothetical protein